MKKVTVIGSGVAGLSSASYLAKKGHQVHLIEKNDSIGGRARVFKSDGFTFDMGPSWYWMPEVFEQFFNDFGHTASDFYDLKLLPESFQVFFKGSSHQVPNNYNELRDLFETIEGGSAEALDRFMDDAKFKYDFAFNGLIYSPGLSVTEYFDFNLIKNTLKHKIFSSFRKVVNQHFKSPELRFLMEFPVLFLGATPQNTPALYSLMNYAGYKLGTWYPMGGMHQIIKAFEKVAQKQGVTFETDFEVDQVAMQGKTMTSVSGNSKISDADTFVSALDYHHFDQKVLPPNFRQYSEKYWDKRELAPTSLLFYLGVSKKVVGLKHHNLFFDADLDQHSKEIYDEPAWPSDPLFYVCCPSKTDDSVAPAGYENLFILMPLAPDIPDSQEMRDEYFHRIISRIEERIKFEFKDAIVYKRDYCVSDFKKDYHSFKGNAYGLANTIRQTGILKPKMKSSKIENLYYAGQLTVPGPGLPPSIISGKIVSELIN